MCLILLPLFEYIVSDIAKIDQGGVMGRRCFISYKSKDNYYRDKILEMGLDISLVPAGSGAVYYGESCAPEKLRQDVFPDSTVTIYLIGEHSGESDGSEKQKYIRKELQASLCTAQDGFCSGILGVVLPRETEMRGTLTSMSERSVQGRVFCLTIYKNGIERRRMVEMGKGE